MHPTHTHLRIFFARSREGRRTLHTPPRGLHALFLRTVAVPSLAVCGALQAALDMSLIRLLLGLLAITPTAALFAGPLDIRLGVGVSPPGMPGSAARAGGRAPPALL